MRSPSKSLYYRLLSSIHGMLERHEINRYEEDMRSNIISFTSANSRSLLELGVHLLKLVGADESQRRSRNT